MNPIDAALLPELWALVRGYTHPVERLLLRALGIMHAEKDAPVMRINLIEVVANGQLNVMDWLWRKP